MNLHALVDPPTDPLTDVEPEDDEIISCPACTSTEFQQYYSGRMTGARYIEFRDNGTVDTYQDSEETEERDSDLWECIHGHSLDYETAEEINERYIQNA